MQSTRAQSVFEAQPAIDSQSPLRILHLVSSLAVGGMEHFVLRLAEEQQRYGHTTAVLAVRNGPLAEEADRMGVKTLVLRGGRVERVLRNLWAVGQFRPDVIHPHNAS